MGLPESVGRSQAMRPKNRYFSGGRCIHRAQLSQGVLLYCRVLVNLFDAQVTEGYAVGVHASTDD